MDAETREIVGCYIGDHSGESAQKLWQSLPAIYRQRAIIPKHKVEATDGMREERQKRRQNVRSI